MKIVIQMIIIITLTIRMSEEKTDIDIEMTSEMKQTNTLTQAMNLMSCIVF